MPEHPEVSDFIAHLRLKNLSPRTITEYRKVLNSLFAHTGLADSSPKDITTAQLRDYVASLQRRGLAAKTVSNRVLVMKRFFGFLVAEGYIEEDPSLRIPRPKVGKRLPKALSIPDVQALFAAFRGNTAAERRDRIFSELVYACGLRISEAVSIKLKDIDFTEGTLRIIGKGNKERRTWQKADGRWELSAISHQLSANLGHASPSAPPFDYAQDKLRTGLATTGIYTQLADDVTKKTSS